MNIFPQVMCKHDYKFYFSLNLSIISIGSAETLQEFFVNYFLVLFVLRQLFM